MPLKLHTRSRIIFTLFPIFRKVWGLLLQEHKRKKSSVNICFGVQYRRTNITTTITTVENSENEKITSMKNLKNGKKQVGLNAPGSSFLLWEVTRSYQTHDAITL